MTNQEAIDILKRAVAEVEWEYPMEIAAAIDKAIEALAKDNNVPNNGWINSKHILPYPNTTVLAYMAWGGYSVLTYEQNHFFIQGSMVNLPDEAVTYWTALPEPPKEET